ncbi:MAG: nucleotide disphospho-sugar-binding domain-containing protein [Planctomycetota bacterium]
MPHVLCVSSELPGMIYACVELARRLRGAGHRVTFAAVPAAREIARHHGLDFVELELGRLGDFARDDAKVGYVRRLMTVKSRRQAAIDATGADRFERFVRELQPDLLLIDGEMHEQIIAASATGVPIALLNALLSIWRRPGLPPPHHAVHPGVGIKGSAAGIGLLWAMLRGRKWWRLGRHRVRRAGCDRVAVLRGLAKRVGFDFRGEVDASQWLIPFTYRRLPVLNARAIEFEFPHEPHPHVHYVGPMLLEARIDRTDPAVRAELEDLFERRRRSGGERKLIYAGFGAYFSTEIALLRRLIAAVAERPDWDLVISLARGPEGLGELPNNVRTYAWVPQIDVLRNADLSVNHGGINTIDECVVYGVPMVIYTGAETDMKGATARAEHHEVGVSGDPRRDTPATIRARMEHVMDTPRYAANIARLRQSYARYIDDRVVERVVESLLRG